MICLNNICKIYKSGNCETKALDQVSLKIEDGEYVAIMGASGSGKSTLLNIIGCMDILTSGEYNLDEIKVHNMKMIQLHSVRKEKISFVFQHFALMKHCSVYENVELPLLAKNMRRSERKQIILEKLEMLGISELKEKLPIHISGGQQQRVALARALASNNGIILADEPTGALDKKNGDDLMEIFKQINDAGKTIIIVTHDEKVARKTKRIITLSDGKIVEDIKNE